MVKRAGRVGHPFCFALVDNFQPPMYRLISMVYIFVRHVSKVIGACEALSQPGAKSSCRGTDKTLVKYFLFRHQFE